MSPKQLERLILAHRHALELFAAQWTQTPEECVQDAFLKLFRSEQPIANQRAWLFRVVKNLAIDSGRSESSRKRREQTVGKERKLFSQHSTSLDVADLQTALQALDHELREVIVARIWGKLTLEEISDAFSIAISTAHRRYETGIVQLKKHFQVPSESSHE
jgi:RNA polymerase sigma-70 factor (ECF subfamily)